jgi:hypothetical protein
MPKQVRIRRGTTAQHATFVGADGEVTFDTTKKVLVVHDGVTAGGKPVDGFVVLDPGAPLSAQVINTTLQVSGGDSDTFGLIVINEARFDALIYAQAGVYPRRIQMQHEAVVYAAAVNLDFNGVAHKRIDLAGNLSLTGTNMDYGKSLLLRIAADGSTRNLAFPVGWRFVGAAGPANIAANKVALLRLECFGTTDADIVARFLVEP